MSQAIDKCQNLCNGDEEVVRDRFVEFDVGIERSCNSRSSDDRDAVCTGDFLDFLAYSISSLCDHDGTEAVAERLADLGFVPGTPVCVVRRAPLGDPIEVEIRGYRLCLRAEEAAAVCTRPATSAG